MPFERTRPLQKESSEVLVRAVRPLQPLQYGPWQPKVFFLKSLGNTMVLAGQNHGKLLRRHKTWDSDRYSFTYSCSTC